VRLCGARTSMGGSLPHTMPAARLIDVLRGPETKTYAASNVARPEDPRLIQL